MRSRNLFLRTVGFVCAVLLIITPVRAQSSASGALSVTVTDSSSAVIPGATVSVKSSAGFSRTQNTDQDGTSTFTLLPVGNYEVSISAAGFSTVVLPSVTIDVTETHVLRQALTVGAQSQTVTVAAETQTIQTENATMGSVVSNDSINALPLVSRNYMQILTMSSGSGSDVVNAATVGHGTPQIYVNGMPNTGNNFQMDGAEINSIASGTGQDTAATTFGSVAIPSPDAIEEFKVQTEQYDASYGRSAGGNVNVVTKSGTNEIHGSMFEYLRNNKLNANDFFRNRNDQPRAELKQNQFGGTLGGPIKKDKVFLFLSYQGTRQIDGLDPSATSSVTLPPQLTDTNRSAAALGAAFCPANNPAGSTWANVYNPTPSVPTPAADKVACNGSNINPIALQLLNTKLPNGLFAIPSPQIIINPGAANALGNSVYSSPAVYNEDQGLVNLDYVLSSKETISVRTLYAYSPERLGLTSNQPPGTSGDYYLTGNDNAVVRLTSVINSNLVNVAQASVSYIRAHDAPTDPLTTTQFGITPAQNAILQLPVITVGSPALFAIGGSTTAGKPQPQTTYEATDQLSWVRGAHTLHLGFLQNRLTWHYGDYGQDRGSLTFRTFADFLLGLSATQNGTSAAGQPNLSNINSETGSIGVPYPFGTLHGNESAAFVNDDWKVNSKLTVNFGVRWEYDGLVSADNGDTQEPWLSLFETVPIPPASGTYVGLTMPANYPGTLPAGIYRRPLNVQTQNGSPWDDFAPRLGIAWQPFGATSKLVVRTGYGWFYSLLNQQEMAQSAILAPPLAETLSLSGTTNSTATWASPFPPPPPSPPGFTPYLRTPTSKISYPGGVYQNLVVPLVQSYNLNLQYALPGNMVLEVGYVGNRGERLGTLRAFNIPTLATPTAPVNCAAPSGCVTTNTSANAASRVPILGIVPGGLKLQGNFGDSEYNSVQASLRKQLSKGLQFQVAYTFSKTMTNFEGTAMALRTSGGDVDSNDPANLDQQRGPAEFNRPQRLVVSYLYQLPGLKGQNRALGVMTSGWSVSGVTTVQDGDPLTITDPNGGQAYGSVATARAQFCPGMSAANVLTPGSTVSNLNDFLNAGAFCASPIVGAFASPGPGLPASPGATGYGNSARGLVLGPGQFNWDMSITKSTRVGGLSEDASLEFRAQFFNAFNHPQFSAPVVALGPTFGQISSLSVAPRIIQFGLRYAF